MGNSNSRHIPWALFVSELIGTALLVLVGLSPVIFMFGTGTPMARLIPSEGLRSLITAFLFGTTGASIALCPVGKVSGAHFNPFATPAFRLMGKLDLQTILMGDELRRTQGEKNEEQRQRRNQGKHWTGVVVEEP